VLCCLTLYALVLHRLPDAQEGTETKEGGCRGVTGRLVALTGAPSFHHFMPDCKACLILLTSNRQEIYLKISYRTLPTFRLKPTSSCTSTILYSTVHACTHTRTTNITDQTDAHLFQAITLRLSPDMQLMLMSEAPTLSHRIPLSAFFFLTADRPHPLYSSTI